jgi:hypothetical protein
LRIVFVRLLSFPFRFLLCEICIIFEHKLPSKLSRELNQHIIYYEGLSDEVIIDGSREVSKEVRELWLQCHPIKEKRLLFTRGQPRGPARYFLFSKVLRCQRCHQPFYGETVYQSGNTGLRFTHERHHAGRNCDTWPRSQSVEVLSDQFQDRVLSHMVLPYSWKSLIMEATRDDNGYQVDT